MSVTPNAATPTNERLRTRRPRLHYALAAPTAGLLALGALAIGAPAASASPQDESRAAARFVSGSVLDGTNLDEVAALQGVRAVNHGSAEPVTDTNDLNLSAFGNTVLDVPGGVTIPLSDLVALGAANQYAQASDEGVSRSASGAVSDAGVVDTSGSTTFPSDVRLDLAPLLQAPLTQVVDEVALSLQAVTGVAALDAAADGGPATTCEDLSAPEHCRDYQIAGGRLTIGAPALAALAGALTGANGLAAQLDTAVAGLSGPDGALADALTQLGTQLGALTGGPGLTVSVTSNARGAVAAVVDAPLVDADGVVTIDLQTGKITVDLDKLMRANTGKGLNDLPPNTEILSAAVIADLVDRIGDLLDSAGQNVLASARAALNAATVSASGALCLPGSSGATCSTPGVDVGNGLLVNVSGTVATVLDGTATTSVVLKTLGKSTPLPTGDVLAAVAAPINAALFGNSGALPTLTSAVNAAVGGVLDALAPLFDALPGLVSLIANVQEAGPTEGSYREVAVRVRLGSALTGGEGLVRLDLGKAEVGANLLGKATPGTATPVAGPPPATEAPSEGPTLPSVGAGLGTGWLTGLGMLLLASGAALVGLSRQKVHA